MRSFLLFYCIFCNLVTFLYCPKLSCTFPKFLAVITLGFLHYPKIAHPGFLTTIPVYLARLWMVPCLLFTTYVVRTHQQWVGRIWGGGGGGLGATSSTIVSLPCPSIRANFRCDQNTKNTANYSSQSAFDGKIFDSIVMCTV